MAAIMGGGDDRDRNATTSMGAFSAQQKRMLSENTPVTSYTCSCAFCSFCCRKQIPKLENACACQEQERSHSLFGDFRFLSRFSRAPCRPTELPSEANDGIPQ